MSIQPRIQTVESFNVTGLCVRTKNSDEFNAKTAKLPGLWQKFKSSDLATRSGNIYGIYSDYSSGVNDFYNYTVGIISDNEKSTLSSININPGKYLVFQATGPMPETVITTWQHIWKYFENKSEWQRSYKSDFEFYSGPEQIEVYIGIE